MEATMTQLVKYNVTEAEIAVRETRYASLSADTPQGYKEVRLAIADIREARVTIEKQRVDLKADALAYGRLVDSEARRLTCMLEAIEEPLKAKKAVIDDEKARRKAEEDAAKLAALELEIRLNRERQDAEARAQRELEEAKLAEAHARLDAERQQLAEERRQAEEAARVAREDDAAKRRQEDQRLQAEREAIEKQRREVEAARAKAEREEFERQAKIKAEKDAREKVEREQREAAERQARLDALRPDVEKVAAFAATIRALVPPKTRTKEAKAVINAAVNELIVLATNLEATVSYWKGAA